MVKLSGQLSAVLFSFSILSCYSSAQTTPSEFAEMSLQELFMTSIDEDSQQASTSPWFWSLQYKTVEYDGYLDGTTDLSLDDVLFTPGQETRTALNFPVVPTVIDQQATILGIGYKLSSEWRVQASFPRIRQSTDHISIVPNYEEFVITSSGMGDVVLTASHLVSSQTTHQWWLSAGVSLPTGSIDEKGDTPRAPGDQQLPYTMQLGSGTYDFPIELSYQKNEGHDIAFGITATLRTGKNDRDYRLGNRFAFNGRYRFDLAQDVKGIVGAEAQYIQAINGADQSLLVPAAIPYPASITNPNLYGGKKVIAKLGLQWQLKSHYQFSLEGALPVYQNLNGPQPKERWRFAMQLSRVL